MRPRQRISIIQSIVWIVLVGAAAHAQSADPLTRSVDSIFARYPATGPGCAVGIYQNARIAFAKGYGLANLEYGVPITPTTPFIVGSLSKQFTAAAIALLIEEKRIGLFDDVRKYVPELPDYGTPITIDQLVHHTSGLRDWWELVGVAGLRFDDTYTVRDVLDMTRRQHGLNFPPGSRYVYSNTGYIVLGVVVERVTGKSLRAFAAERFFGPLGMKDTHFQDDHTEIVSGRAYAYSAAQPAGHYTINVWNNDLVGQGGVMTTIADLAKWDENFYTGAVGGPAFLAQMQQRGRLTSGTQLTYAFGLEMGKHRGLDLVEHTGSTGGYRTVLSRYPRQHTSIALLCNLASMNTTTLSRSIAQVVLRDQFTAPAATPVVAGSAPTQQSTAPKATLTPAALAAFTGRYYSDELDATYELAATGSGLVLTRPRARPDTLTARDSVTFTGAVGSLKFAMGRDRKAERFVLDASRVQNLTFLRKDK